MDRHSDSISIYHHMDALTVALSSLVKSCEVFYDEDNDVVASLVYRKIKE